MKSPSRHHLPDFTKGPIISSLFALALPIIFSNILQTAYQMTDAFWVGRMGASAVAAVSLSFPITFLLMSLGGGFSIAGAILVAQYKGKGDMERVDHISAQTLIMLMFVSIILSVTGYFLSETLMRMMGAAPDVLMQATGYLQATFVGSIFLFGYFVFQSLMRGIGDVKTPILIVFVTVLMNFVLDPLFIFGYGPVPAYGVMGAAISTVACQGVATIWGLSYLFNGRRGIHIRRKHMKPDFPELARMFWLGLPSSIDQSARALGMTLITLLVASFGTVAVAAYGISTRILMLVIIPTMGLAMATSTLVGQNIGAGKMQRAEDIGKKSALIGFIALTIIGMVVLLLAEPLSRFFIPNDLDVISASTQFIQIIALSFGFIALHQVMSGVFTGAGNTSMSMMLTIMSLWVFQLPLAYFLSTYASLGSLGIWWAYPITNIIAASTALFLFMRGTWKQKHILSPTKELQDKVIVESVIDEVA